MSRGYIKLYRKMLENPIVCKDNDYVRVWIELLLKVTHKCCFAISGGKRITLKPGQLVTGRRVLAEACNIDPSKAERILKAFEKEHQIEQHTTNTDRIITIVNWDIYQNNEQQNEHQANNN